MKSTAFFIPMKIVFKLYIIITITVIAAQLVGNQTIENLSKPLLMLSLLWGFASVRKWKFNKLDYSFMTALFFSFLGDVFLMPFFNIFLAGLVSFLIAHLIYIYIFIKEIQKPIQFTATKISLMILGVLIYLSLLLVIYQSLIPQNTPLLLLIAIGSYATVLFGVFISALFRKDEPQTAYIFILMGAISFLLSDSFLAINKFVFPLPYSTLWVMPTYALAQAFICYGFLKRDLISIHSK